MKLAEKIDIIRYNDKEFANTMDLMVNEISLRLEIRGVARRILYCSPSELEELVLGHLYTQGYIHRMADLEYLDIDDLTSTASIGIRAGIDKVLPPEPISCDENVTFSARALMQNLARFYDESTLQKATAGVHRAALCDDGNTYLACIDVSRHNAFDKLVGKALMNGISLQDKYMITSGRVPYDMMKKAVAIEIPMLVSRSTPTIAAVELARKSGITLLGFARENRFNLYCGEQRIDECTAHL